MYRDTESTHPDIEGEGGDRERIPSSDHRGRGARGRRLSCRRLQGDPERLRREPGDARARVRRDRGPRLPSARRGTGHARLELHARHRDAPHRQPVLHEDHRGGDGGTAGHGLPAHHRPGGLRRRGGRPRDRRPRRPPGRWHRGDLAPRLPRMARTSRDAGARRHARPPRSLDGLRHRDRRRRRRHSPRHGAPVRARPPPHRAPHPQRGGHPARLRQPARGPPRTVPRAHAARPVSTTTSGSSAPASTRRRRDSTRSPCSTRRCRPRSSSATTSSRSARFGRWPSSASPPPRSRWSATTTSTSRATRRSRSPASNQAGEAMGERAIRLLLERIQGRTEPTHFSVEPTLKVRGSTRPAAERTDPLTPTPRRRPAPRTDRPPITPATPGHHHERTRMSVQLPDPRRRRPRRPRSSRCAPSTPKSCSASRAPACDSRGAPLRHPPSSATRCAGTAPTRGMAEPVASADSIGVVAPGPALEPGEVRRYAVRIATEAGWSAWSEELVVEASVDPADARGTADRRLGARRGPGDAAPHGLHASRRTPCGPAFAPRSGASASCAINGRQRDRRASRARMDRLPASASCSARGTSPTCCTRARTRSARCSATAGTAAASAGRTAPSSTAPSSPRSCSSTSSAPTARTCASRRRPSGRRRPAASARRASTTAWRSISAPSPTAGTPPASTTRPGRRPARSASTPRASSRASPAASARSASGTSTIEPRDGHAFLDAGQNIAGWLRLVVRGSAGDRVEVRHAEVLEPDGSIHTKSLRTARATDGYVLAHDGETTLEPTFTFHGFQYAEVTGAEVVSATAVADVERGSPRSEFAARTRASSDCTPTSPGRSATTSSRSPPTARSATSGWAGPATRRRSRRPRARSSTWRRSGCRGCATSSSTRTPTAPSPPSCRTS